MMESLFIVVPVFLLIFLTSFISGVLGVAGGLVLMGGLLYLLPVPEAMLVHGVAQFISNATRVYLWRRYLVLSVTWKALLGSLLCMLPFIFISYVPTEGAVFLFLGISTLGMQAIPARRIPSITHRGVAFFCGFFSTGLQLIAGVSGTFVDQFFLHSNLDRRAIVATKAVIQTALHFQKIIYFGALAVYAQTEAFWAALIPIPFIAVAGAATAGLVLARITDAHFKTWTQRVLFLVGSYYVIQGLQISFFAS